jgi:hypothetical protein
MLRCRDGHRAAMPRRDTLGTSLQDTVTHKYTERKLIQAYLVRILRSAGDRAFARCIRRQLSRMALRAHTEHAQQLRLLRARGSRRRRG